MRRGWLLLALQPIAIALVAGIAAALIDGTRWLIVFPPLIVLFLIWLGQALDAYHRALRAGHGPGGEWAVAAAMSLMLLILTAFWVIGGRNGSPAATLEAYTDAWLRDRPEAAAQMFVVARAPEDLRQLWAAERYMVVERIIRARALYGRDSGLNPDRPFDSLRFREGETTDGRVAMVGEIVRSERVETTLLGFVPTASQQTIVVQPGLTIWMSLERQPRPGWLDILALDSPEWRILSIEEPAEQ